MIGATTPRIAFVALLVAAALTTRPDLATAQQVMSLEQLRDCLCLAEALESERANSESARAAYEEHQRAIVEATQQIRDGYDLVNENNPYEVESYKRLLHRKDQLQAQFQSRIDPEYRYSVARYNEVVDRYNQQCAPNVYDERTLYQAKRTQRCGRR